LYQYRNFSEFIAVLRLAARSLVTAGDFARVAYEYIETGHRVGNLRYVEFFFNPSYHYPSGVAYQTQLAGLIEGITAAQRDFGGWARLIPSIDREFGVAIAEVVDARSIAPNAVQAAWLAEPSRTQLRRAFLEEVQRIGGQ
jgi:adenosine deaminase